MKRRFWLSWVQPTEDFRPLKDPPNPAILGWWCSGYDAKNHATLCALVESTNEKTARHAVLKDWPELGEWRFFNETEADWLPGDRFPIDSWMKERCHA